MRKIYKMKKIILVLFLMSSTVFAQDYKEIIAQETCNCVTKLNLDTLSGEALNQAFANCLLQSYENNIDNVPENEKLDYSNTKQLEKFGEELAIKMLSTCSQVILKLGEESIESTESSDLMMQGAFYGTKISDPYFTVLLKDATGEINEFILLDYFQNANLITNKLIENNQEIDLYYYEAELFNTKLNDFVVTKIITDIVKK